VGLGVLFGGAATLVAVLIPWLPPVASKQRDRIDFVFWFTTGISIAVFALVAAVIAYSLVKFRVRPDDDSDGPPIHGHTGVEIVWTDAPRPDAVVWREERVERPAQKIPVIRVVSPS